MAISYPEEEMPCCSDLTALQSFEVGRHIRGERTIEQPALQRRMQGGGLGHGYLLSGRGDAVLLPRQTYVQPGAPQGLRSGAMTGRPSHWVGQLFITENYA